MSRKVALTLTLLAACARGVALHAAHLADGRGFHMDQGIVRGVRAYVTTAPVPLLHGGEFSLATVMASNDDAGNSRYAQVGYTRDVELPGLHLFVQWVRDDGQVMDVVLPGAPGGGDHLYTCLQNPSTGVWTFKYDEATLAQSSGTTWRANEGEFFGEVSPDAAVQMVGDIGHRVTFSYMQRYAPICGASWRGIWPDRYVNDSPNDWAQDVSQANGYFRIWDTTP